MTSTTTAAFWDRLAPKYAKQPIANTAAYEASLTRTLAHLRAEDHVLELGCGTGSTAVRLAPHVASYLGTDIASGMIDIARQKGTDTPHLTFDTRNVSDMEAETYTRILAFNLLHLLPDLDATLSTIHQNLPSGGLFISKTPCLASKPYFRPLVWGMRMIGKAPWVGFFSPDDLKAKCFAHGFEIIEDGLYPPSTPAQFIVARKP